MCDQSPTWAGSTGTDFPPWSLRKPRAEEGPLCWPPGALLGKVTGRAPRGSLNVGIGLSAPRPPTVRLPKCPLAACPFIHCQSGRVTSLRNFKKLNKFRRELIPLWELGTGASWGRCRGRRVVASSQVRPQPGGTAALGMVAPVDTSQSQAPTRDPAHCWPTPCLLPPGARMVPFVSSSSMVVWVLSDDSWGDTGRQRLSMWPLSRPPPRGLVLRGPPSRRGAQAHGASRGLRGLPSPGLGCPHPQGQEPHLVLQQDAPRGWPPEGRCLSHRRGNPASDVKAPREAGGALSLCFQLIRSGAAQATPRAPSQGGPPAPQPGLASPLQWPWRAHTQPQGLPPHSELAALPIKNQVPSACHWSPGSLLAPQKEYPPPRPRDTFTHTAPGPGPEKGGL